MTTVPLIPSLKNLTTAYKKIQHPVVVLNELDVVQFSQWSRFDPRLMEQLILTLVKRWPTLNPLLVRELSLKTRFPQALAVILEHVAILAPSELFEAWRNLVCQGMTPLPYQRFFMGLDKIGSPRALKSAGQPIKVFKKWGFLEDELILRGSKPYPRYSFAAATRQQILAELLRSNKKIKIGDYLKALKHSLSRRQALRDLENFPGLKARGASKARRYFLVA